MGKRRPWDDRVVGRHSDRGFRKLIRRGFDWTDTETQNEEKGLRGGTVRGMVDDLWRVLVSSGVGVVRRESCTEHGILK